MDYIYIIDTKYHVDLVNAISNILFNLIYVCGIWFWNFCVRRESFGTWNTL